MPSPVVQLNRAGAVATADGPAAGLELVGAIEASGATWPAGWADAENHA